MPVPDGTRTATVAGWGVVRPMPFSTRPAGVVLNVSVVEGTTPRPDRERNVRLPASNVGHQLGARQPQPNLVMGLSAPGRCRSEPTSAGCTRSWT